MKLVRIVPLTVLLPLASPAVAVEIGTLRVTAVRNWTETDPSPVSRAFRVYVIVGTMDGKRYTAQQIHSWGSQDFHVGEDYAVTKATDRELSVVTHDKKGREVKDLLDVTGVEETGSSKN